MVYPEFARYIRSLELRRGPLDPRAGGYDQGFYAYWTGATPGRQSLSRPTAPTTSPGRTAGPRRSTRTSAGPARASPEPEALARPPPRSAPSGRGRSSAAGIALRLAEPHRPGRRRQDHRHPVMHRRDVGVGRAGDGGEARHLRPARRRQRSQTAAKARIGADRARIAQRALRRRSPVHSYQPLTGTRQRRGRQRPTSRRASRSGR